MTPLNPLTLGSLWSPEHPTDRTDTSHKTCTVRGTSKSSLPDPSLHPPPQPTPPPPPWSARVTNVQTSKSLNLNRDHVQYGFPGRDLLSEEKSLRDTDPNEDLPSLEPEMTGVMSRAEWCPWVTTNITPHERRRSLVEPHHYLVLDERGKRNKYFHVW